MSTELQVVHGGALTVAAPNPGYTPEQIELLKRTICQGATDDEFALFIARAERTGLDPFARQIYAVKRWDNRLGREVMTIQVGIDGFRLIAERTGNYVPGREPTYEYDAQGNVLTATAYVRKWSRGDWHETAAKAYWDEYCQTNKHGKLVGMWEKMPHNQLAKCAEALALRRAFPQELGGLYTPDEMGQAENPANNERKRPAPANDNSDYEKWKGTRLEIVSLINALPADRKAHWVAEIETRVGNREMRNTTTPQLEELLSDIRRAEQGIHEAPHADDDIIDAEVSEPQTEPTDDPPAAAAADSAPSKAPKPEPLGKQQLRVLINNLKCDYWMNPVTRDHNWGEFLQAHFGIPDIANADQKTLHLVANALQGRINARKAELEADEVDNPFAKVTDDTDDPWAGQGDPFDPDPALSGGAA